MKKLMLLLCLSGFTCLAQDTYMGDYRGTLRDADGAESELCAQVWATGKGGYQAIFKKTLYQVPAAKELLKLDGTLQGEAVVFPQGGATLAKGVFSGKIPLGEIKLKSFELKSPTLGLAPPAGATVLVGPGLRLSQWRNSSRAGGIVDLNKQLSKTANCVGYMRNTIVSDRAQQAILYTGSDDGLIVFLNGEKVYEKNVPRSLTTDNDKIPVSLRAGENVLLLKVTQGGGDWAAHARLVDANNNPLAGVTYKLHPAGTPMDKLGSIISWELSGPYTQEGKSGMALGDVAFAPESGGDATWKRFDGSQTGGERWNVLDDGGVIEMRRGGGSIVSGPEFGSCQLHVEFKTSYMPEARGQGRCNSGVYVQGRYEIQVLDSYALEGRDNECGGIYQLGRPLVNMCLPPERWQTYDIDYTAASFDAEGNKTSDAVITVRHNGVVIHDNLKLRVTPGGLGGKDVAKGPLMFQDHGNVLWFRNVWFLEK